MKRTLLASAFCLGLSVQARAQIVCANCDTELGAVWRHVQDLGKWVDQLQAMQRQYQMLTSQYQAIAHLPQNVAGMASGLTTSPTLQNPFPQSYAITNITNGSALGPVTGLANQLKQTNTYYAPTGDDAAAVEMRTRSGGLAGIQAMAVNAMHSLEQRSASLGQFLQELEARRTCSSRRPSRRGCNWNRTMSRRSRRRQRSSRRWRVCSSRLTSSGT